MTKRMLAALLCALLLVFCAGASAQAAEENTQAKHYLLLGQDGYADDIVKDARTDTIVLVTLDTKYNRVIMTSILRDSKIKNPSGNETKANLIYKGYGFKGIISCLERELALEIEGAVLVNFEHVKPIIDALGGVDIVIDENEYIAIKKILLGKDPNMPKGPGMTHMTGRIALAYMRDRSSGSGDFSRTERQRKVVSQLFDKCRDLSLMELIGIYNTVSGGMEMSLSAMDILGALSSGYQLVANGADFVEFHIPDDGTYSYGTVGSSSSALEVRWKTNRDRLHALINSPEGQ
ncbi:MAG: LCP family protein [Clostridia bacterium]|nr:LCP family protein [Clostridia bacterium]